MFRFVLQAERTQGSNVEGGLQLTGVTVQSGDGSTK